MSKKTQALEVMIKRLTRHNFAGGPYLLSRAEATFILGELEHKLAISTRRHEKYVENREQEIERSKKYQRENYDRIKIRRHEAYLEEKRQALQG